MRLSPGERSILAYFPSTGKARAAIEALKAAGIEGTQLDRVSRYGVEPDAHYDNLINRAQTVTGPTLFSKDANRSLDSDTRVLLAADPSASGYGCEDYGVAGGRAFMVTVVVSEEKLNQAVAILKQNGGLV